MKNTIELYLSVFDWNRTQHFY